MDCRCLSSERAMTCWRSASKTDITRGDPRSTQRRRSRRPRWRGATADRSRRDAFFSVERGRRQLGMSPGDYFRPAR